jgi:hypothetical protein
VNQYKILARYRCRLKSAGGGGREPIQAEISAIHIMMVVFKAEPWGKESAKGTKSHLASEFRCNCCPPMSAEILERFAAEHRVDFHWALFFIYINEIKII